MSSADHFRQEIQMQMQRAAGRGAKAVVINARDLHSSFGDFLEGIAAGEPTQCLNLLAVVARAEALSRKQGNVGAVAFSRTGDPATGDFGDAKVLKRFGRVPDDLSGL